MIESPQSTTSKRAWLSKSLFADTASATMASFVLAMPITVVDVSIIRNANGSMLLKDGLKQGFKEIFTKPHNLVRRREFLFVWALYAGTYTVANVTTTLCKFFKKNPEIPTFVATTAYNMPVCVAKDRALSRWFGVIKPSAFPMSSLSLFAIRDCMTIYASFSGVPRAADYLTKRTSMSHGQAITVSQLLLPILTQNISTPLHLLALDKYNIRTGRSAAARINFIRKLYWESVFSRQVRIGFAFGLGGVGNRWLLQNLHRVFSISRE